MLFLEKITFDLSELQAFEQVKKNFSELTGRKESVHMVNSVKLQNIVQCASENGWKHLRLGLD